MSELHVPSHAESSALSGQPHVASFVEAPSRARWLRAAIIALAATAAFGLLVAAG